MPTYTPVCRTDDVSPGQARLVKVKGKEIALFNVGGTFRAMEDTCLHAGGPLHEGELEGSIVTCPWHGWQFDVENGSCNLNPMVSLTCYDVRVVDGMVEVKADSS